jgi:hypothetical protein
VSKNAMKMAIYLKASEWWFYEIIARLVAEGLLVERTEGSRFTVTLYQLSKKGFEHISHDLPDLVEKRFAAQSVTHDAFATAFHLGDFVHGTPNEVQLLSEQELQCFDTSLYPIGIPKTRDHIPDGYTIVENGTTRRITAFEIEVNAKGPARYDKVSLHFDLARDVDCVLWLVQDAKVFSLITERFLEIKTRRYAIHNFVTIDQFVKDGWSARIFFGSFKNQTIHDVLNPNGPQTPPKGSPKPTQNQLSDIFLKNAKSPRALAA